MSGANTRGKPWMGPAAAAAIFSAGYLAQASKLHLPKSTESKLAEIPFQLVDVTAQAGLINKHEAFEPHSSLRNVAPLISAIGGASAAVVDFDNDGWPDVYLTNSAIGSHNRLFRNNHDGTFTDVADQAGLGDVNRDAGSLRALFFDYDNDGCQDILLTTTYCAKLFHNDCHGRFTEVTKESGINFCDFAVAANVFDYDHDGKLDLIIGGYFKDVDPSNPADFQIMPNNGYNPTNGGFLQIYHNDGHGKFSKAPDNLGVISRGWNLAIGVYDLRNAGRPDLYLGSEHGSDRLYYLQGNGRYLDMSESLAVPNYNTGGMSAEIADADNDGNPLVMATKLHYPGESSRFNALWKISSSGELTNLKLGRYDSYCGQWSWGAKFLDLDNGFYQDLVITNGFLSANPGRSYWYAMSVLRGSNQLYAMDARKYPPMNDASLGGYQPKCVYHRDGDIFHDVSILTPLADDFSDGRALAAIDYRNNGNMALVEANWRGPARLYAALPKSNNHWIGFNLVGTRSNRDAVGAVVVLKVKDGKSGKPITMSRQVFPANGFLSESDKRLHFGLGLNPDVEEVQVRWPSGTRQFLKTFQLDRYNTVLEPEWDQKNAS